jgi:hypothetical protein
MKQLTYSLVLGSMLVGSTLRGNAQAFNSGSTGAYGPMNIAANTTLDLPPDGIFHCTTINVAQGVTLRFNRNQLNTPVYLLATGDVTVSGTIDVSGSDGSPTMGGTGGPGGFGGGGPGIGGLAPGAGQGPGGGFPGTNTTTAASAGNGIYSTPHNNGSANNGAVYGSPLLVPLVGGSGGGGSPDFGGAGGGGAILLASSSRITVNGAIRARGGTVGSARGLGSGGAIRLVSPEVGGNGALDTAGGFNAGPGRTRIDSISRSGAQFNITGPWTYGGFMAVFANPLPTLDIINAAGTPIPEGTASAVTLNLPFGTSPTQNITVQARDFAAAVPIRLVLTPESGQPVVYDATIDNSTANPATVTIPATVPLNTVVSVNAWTR